MRALLYMYFLFVNSFYSRFLWMVNFNLNGSAHIRAFHLCKCSASIALLCFALLDNRLSRIPCTTLFGNFFLFFLSRCRFLCGFFFAWEIDNMKSLDTASNTFFCKSAVAKNFKNVHWNSATAHALSHTQTSIIYLVEIHWCDTISAISSISTFEWHAILDQLCVLLLSIEIDTHV